MPAVLDGYAQSGAAVAVAAAVELPLRQSHRDRRRGRHRIPARFDAGVLAVVVAGVVAGLVQGVVLVLVGIRQTRRRLHSRNRRQPIGHLAEEQRHRIPRIVAVRVADAVAAADEVRVCVLYARWTESDHRDRTWAPSQAGRTCIGPVRRRRAPILHLGVEIHEEPVMSLVSVDFDCIHLVMSQRPNPLPPTGGIWSRFS